MDIPSINNLYYYPNSNQISLPEKVQQNADQIKTQAIHKNTAKRSGAIAPHECKTWKSRTYVDQSGDASVSFKTPTHVSPEAAAYAVSAHESQHVSHEQANASREGREVVSQTVVIHMSLCPEWGRPYVSGGTTTTVTKGKAESANVAGEHKTKGHIVDITV